MARRQDRRRSVVAGRLSVSGLGEQCDELVLLKLAVGPMWDEHDQCNGDDDAYSPPSRLNCASARDRMTVVHTAIVARRPPIRYGVEGASESDSWVKMPPATDGMPPNSQAAVIVGLAADR